MDRNKCGQTGKTRNAAQNNCLSGQKRETNNRTKSTVDET